MDRDQLETALGGHLHRCLDLIDRRQWYSVSSEEYEELFVATRASS